MSGQKLVVHANVKLPTVPKFLLIEGIPGDNGKLDIADVVDADLVALADEWKKELLATAARRRKARADAAKLGGAS